MIRFGASMKILAAAFAGLIAAAPANATVENIGTFGSSGPVTFSSSFIAASDPGAHFGLATLSLDESVTAGGVSGGEPGIAWWDIRILVTRSFDTIGQDVMIAIDKAVTNQTVELWGSLKLTLGTGLDAGFQESDDLDLMFFKPDPAPIEETGAFANPPTFDVDPNTISDNLEWFGPPGLSAGDTASFWMALNVPNSRFGGDFQNVADFTIRAHAIEGETATIPEPSSAALLFVGLAALGCYRRRRS